MKTKLESIEYEKKLSDYMSSNAPVEIKTKAIEDLNYQFFGVKNRALKDFEEAAPDPPEMDED